MTPKRILMVNDHIHFGGGGDAVFRLERSLYESQGHHVSTFSQPPQAPARRNPQDHVFVESRLNSWNKIRKYAGSRKLQKRFREVLQEVRPDLVRVHLVSKYPLSIYPELKPYKVVQTLHGPNLFCATSWGNVRHTSQPCEMGVDRKCVRSGCVSARAFPLYQQFFSRLTPQVQAAVDLHLCPSHFIQEAANHAGLVPNRYFPYGIDHIFSSTSEPLPRFEEPSILVVGALVEPKGINFLVEAMVEVRKHVPAAVLRICGRGPQQEALEKQVADLSLGGNVRFCGFTERPELLELYQQSHCLAVPSVWAEQFGLIGPEALASETPVVATRVGGIPEWLTDGKSGFLVEPRNPQAMAEKLVTLLRDEALRTQMGQFGRQYVLERFAAAGYEARLTELVEEFC